RKPRAVVLCAIGIIAVSIGAATRVRKLYWVFNDLRPDSDLRRDIDYAERACGGIVPLVIYLEPGAEVAARSPAPALEPEALRFLERAKARLAALPEIR